MPTFETARLTLRRLRSEDAEPLHREIYSDHEVVRCYNGDRVFTLEVVRYAFCDLRLQRLLGGAHISNGRSIRLHERLGYRLQVNTDDVTTVLMNPLTAYRVRSYEERDREAASALGTLVIDGWYGEPADASFHLVAETIKTGEIVGHLQGRDRSVPTPTHCPGQCHFSLSIAPAHRRRGLGGYLYARMEAFARDRKALFPSPRKGASPVRKRLSDFDCKQELAACEPNLSTKFQLQRRYR